MNEPQPHVRSADDEVLAAIESGLRDLDEGREMTLEAVRDRFEIAPSDSDQPEPLRGGAQ